MLCASAATPLGVSILFGWVIPHHEVSLIPVGSVVVDVGVVHVLQVVIDTNVEETITLRLNYPTLLTMLHIPSLVSVAPFSDEAFSSPRVSYEEQSFTRWQLQ